ncbi:hypothetical protein Tco_1336023, partial [Tanacetum coccineum]
CFRTTFSNWNCLLSPLIRVWWILGIIVDEFTIRFGVNVSLDSGFPLNGVRVKSSSKSRLVFLNTMADVNVNAPAEQASAMAPPTRTDDQILPRIRWVHVGKSNCYLDVERSQINPIYKIMVDILKNTNFFRAFIASSIILSIYIQQFWDTVRYDKIAGCYRCQLDEKLFDLTKGTLRDALQITPVDTNNPFSSPATPDALINFVNDLGYPKVVRTLSDVVTNDMFQPWRALTTIINLFLMRKTSGFERPRAPVLQILWGVVNRAHIDYAERMFTKLIVYYLQSKHKFYPRLDYPLHFPNKEPVLGYLKFSAKGTKQEVFGMPIPNDLITDDIRGEQYYNVYLEKVAKHQRYLAGEEVSDPDSLAPKPAKATKPKLIDEGVDEGVPDKEPLYGDEEANTQREIKESLKEVHGAHRGPLPPVVFREPDSRKFQPLLEVQGKGKEKVGVEQAAETESDEEVLPVIQSRAQDKGQAGPNPDIQDEGQAGSNPGDVAVSQHQSSHVVHAGPNLEHIDFEENLKLLTKDQVRLEEPTSSAETLSSLQHLDKELSFADQFLVEKSQEDEPEKTNTESEVQSMVTVPIYQDTSSVPLMTTPVEANQALEERLDKQGNRLYNLENLDIPHKVSKAVDKIITDAVDWAIQAPHSDRFRDLPEADMKEILHHRMWESNSY